MIACTTCGHENPDGANFCANCGTPVRHERECAECGRDNPPDLRFCRGCGGGLDEEAAAATNGGGAPAHEHRAPTEANGEGAPVRMGDGRYVVDRFLGEGGRKRVYLAHDTALARDVALAIVKTAGLDEGGRVRVRREAQATSATPASRRSAR